MTFVTPTRLLVVQTDLNYPHNFFYCAMFMYNEDEQCIVENSARMAICTHAHYVSYRNLQTHAWIRSACIVHVLCSRQVVRY